MILRFFYQPQGNSDNIVLSNFKHAGQAGFDWKLVIGNCSGDILDFIKRSEFFSNKRKLPPKDVNTVTICFEITEDELAMLMLQYS